MYKRIFINNNFACFRRDSDGISFILDDDNQDYINFKNYLADNHILIDQLPAVYEGITPVESKLADLEKMRDAVISSGVTYNGHIFMSDEKSQQLINGGLASSERNIPVFPANWILQDGSTVSVSYADMVSVSGLIAAKVQASYANYVNLKAQIEASSDPSSIDILSGWPT